MIHLAELIEDELRERRWTRTEMARRMEPGASPERIGINMLALDLFLEVRCPRVRLGVMAEQFAVALDVDATFFERMHEQWRAQAPACSERCCAGLGAA